MPQITNYRTIDIDSLDPESPANFPISSLLPSNLPPPTTSGAAANLGSQIRQLLRSGDTEGALRHVLDSAPLGGDDRAKEVHLASVVEVLQGIRQTEMTKVLEAVCNGEGGAERGDCLMKYLYKGMAVPTSSDASSKSVSPQSTGFSQIQGRNLGEGGGGQQMSVLLSWHEKLVEIVGVGSIDTVFQQLDDCSTEL